MSRVYICDICKTVKHLYNMNEVIRKYRTHSVCGVKEKQETLHICVNCWDEIKEVRTDKTGEASYKQVTSKLN